MGPSNSHRLLRGWGDAPAVRPHRRPAYEIAAVGLLVLWNVLANTVVPEGIEIPFSLAAAGGLVLIARRAGVGWSRLGMAEPDLRPGLKVGAVAMGVVAIAVVLIGLPSVTRDVLADDRFVGVGTSELLFETLVRIPLATAIGEEVAFRGVLLGLLLVWMSPWRAVAISSAMFGLWHILPGIAALETASGIDAGGSLGVRIGGVAAQVVVTALAGIVFCWLRFRGRHVAAPIGAHAALNAVSFLVGWLIVQNAWA